MAKWKVGITGGIGSGKTFCARLFGQLGIPVYYADDRARDLMHNDVEVKSALIALLGAEAYDENGMLQKSFLREQVFNHPQTRKSINKIVHPAVSRDYELWHKNQDNPYTLKEAALLVESGSYRSLDHLIMVDTPLTTRIQRTMARDGIDEPAVRNRMNSQLPDEDKKAVSDLLIDNSGCLPILPQILNIHRKLLS